MSQEFVTQTRTFQAAGALAAYLRVKLNGSNKLAASGVGATEYDVGVTVEPSLAADDYIGVRMPNTSGTVKMTAAGAFDQEALLYAAASGMVDDAVNGKPIGIALEAATASGDVVEVLPIRAMVTTTVDDVADDVAISIGTGDDAQLLWSTGDADNHSLVIGLGDSNQSLHITDKAAKATDWNVAAVTHPTLFVHSNTTPATDYLSIGGHDGTTATIDVMGGTTLDLDIAGTTALAITAAAVTVTGRLAATGNVGNTAGVGITGTAASFNSQVTNDGGLIKTTILIDLADLNSGGTADDVIGADGAGKAHLGQITAAVNGTIIAGRLTCLETPATGDNDINVYSATEDTGVEDTAIDALTETALCDSGDLAAGSVVALTPPAADQYLYLTGGVGDCDATYSAGILLLEFWGE